MTPSPSPLDALLDRQAGLVSRTQALAVGLTPREVDRHVARRRWLPVHPRVYLVAGRPPTDEVRVRAAALWAGRGAVVVGAAACWWHGIGSRAPETVAVAVPHRGPASRPGVSTRRRTLRAADVVVVRGVRVAVRPLALLDAAVDAGSGGDLLLRRIPVGPGQLRGVAGSAAGAATARRLVTRLVAPHGAGRNGPDSAIATVSCEHRTHPRGRPGRPVPFPGAW